MDQNKIVKSEHSFEDKNICEKCMEKLPHIATAIFAYLDNKSLCQTRQVAKSWLNFIDRQKFYWKRVTQNQPGWDLTLSKIDSEATKILGKCFLAIKRSNLVKDHKIPPIFCALVLSTRWDKLDLLKMLLEKIPSSKSMTISWEDNQGKFFVFSPISFALMRKNSMKCLKYMVNNHKSELNALCSDNLTPLHIAAEAGNCEAVELLMSSEKVDKNPKAVSGATPLHRAASSGSLDVIKLLLKFEYTKIDAVDIMNRTPFHDAAFNGKANVVEFMMKNVINKSPISTQGCNPLHEAAYAGRLDCVKVMLSEGIDCFSRSSCSRCLTGIIIQTF